MERLEDVCDDIVGGGTPSRKIPEYFTGDIVWLTPTEIASDEIREISDSKEKITAEALNRSSARIIPSGSVLLTSRASIGKVAIAGAEVTTNQGFASFVCSNRLHNRYLAYWLWSNKSLLESKSGGTTFKEISKKKLKQLEIPVPPMEQQIAIAALLDSVNNRARATKQELSCIPDMTMRLRMAILSKAFRGELTERIRAIEDGSMLLMKIRQVITQSETKGSKKFKRGKITSSTKARLPSLPESWVWTNMGLLLRQPLRNGKSAKPVKKKKGVPVLTLSSVTFKDFGPHNVKMCDLDPEEVDGLWVEEDDIFIARSNTAEYVGLAAIYKGLNNQFIFPDLMIRARLRRDFALPEYVAQYLDSPYARIYFQRNARSTAGSMPKINQGHILNLPIPLAPIEEQIVLVEKVSSVLDLVTQAESRMRDAETKLVSLEKSLIERAFAGNLILKTGEKELSYAYQSKLEDFE